MQTFIVGFSRSKSRLKIGSLLIQKVENRNFSHAYIRYTDDFTKVSLVAQASHGFVNEMNYDIFKESNVIVEEYQIQCSDEDFKKIVIFIKNNLGNLYSRWELLLIGVKKLFHFELPARDEQKEFICSKFTAMVCDIVNLKIDANLEFVTPSDFNTFIKNLPPYMYKRLT